MRTIERLNMNTHPKRLPERKSGWFVTAMGQKFYPTEPRAEDISIHDIAHALSNICRFGGHVRRFYSVAQHSIFVSGLLPIRLKMAGLLHDATEAYLGDMVAPLKLQIPEFKRVEQQMEKVIEKRFSLHGLHDPVIKSADLLALKVERDMLLNNRFTWPVDLEEFSPELNLHTPFPSEYTPQEAERAFLEMYFYLLGPS